MKSVIANNLKFLKFERHRVGTLLEPCGCGVPAGDPEVIASGIIADDFTFDSDGNIMQAVIGSSEIVKINPTTKTVTTISGSPDSTELSSVSAAQFEGLSGEETTLYVTLNGGNLGDGGAVVPGAVKMIQLGS
ncbi:hypothetical protein D9757_009805 [Collybiopsis confluens]|uniref:Uncharacterized protein n=1 Tax=Collybiopsis confluens TaxID=2823264 RepID=A0A8H5HFI3_9AGAR|nr:hypothetical protein D9757_009805 [Collybiopsis confluens]